MIKHLLRGTAALSLAVFALTVPASASASPAASATPGVSIQVPQRAAAVVIEGDILRQKESSGRAVLCSDDQVLIGRAHTGDENGITTYFCGWVEIDGVPAQVGEVEWSEYQPENRSDFTAPLSKVLVGRHHYGDENGPTRYAFASLIWRGENVDLTSYRETQPQRESASESKGGPGELMVGRKHNGDENGPTLYRYAVPVVPTSS
ncbi:hypothetical protein ACFXA3_07235 [Streptomyces sp. NPDC059456]|uniref:hypothetical protein n=1 Tax=Streptomyces sp. NPDC059456 TaxID=3346838 RepID=UPI00368BDB8A